MIQIDHKFINEDGFVTAQPNAENKPGEGNGWLQTGLAYACGLYEVTPATTNLLIHCMTPLALALIYRSPYKNHPDDDETCDDYWGALPMFPWWADSVLKHAEENKWNFALPGKSGPEYQFDRFPAFPPFLRICAGRTPSLWDSLILAACIVWDALHTDQADRNMAAYCRIKAVEEVSVWCDVAGDLWRNRILAKYGTIGKSWAAYFAPGHPLADFVEDKA